MLENTQWSSNYAFKFEKYAVVIICEQEKQIIYAKNNKYYKWLNSHL